jgi:hypothetical protein
VCGECRVVTTAVLCMKDQCDVENLCFQFCVFAVRTEHQKDVFCEEVLRELEKEEAGQPEEKAETIEKEAPQDSKKCPEEKKNK